MLSADPTAVAADSLDDLEVIETIKEGTTIYRPPWSRTMRMREQIEARSHDASCTVPVIADMVAAMVGAGGVSN